MQISSQCMYILNLNNVISKLYLNKGRGKNLDHYNLTMTGTVFVFVFNEYSLFRKLVRKKIYSQQQPFSFNQKQKLDTFVQIYKTVYTYDLYIFLYLCYTSIKSLKSRDPSNGRNKTSKCLQFTICSSFCSEHCFGAEVKAEQLRGWDWDQIKCYDSRYSFIHSCKP